MNVAHSISADKIEKLVDMAVDLQQFVDQAAADGDSMYETEKGILAKILKMGHLAIDRFLQGQGNGDLGLTVQTEECNRRSGADGQRAMLSLGV
jgi:hypothetical protein